MFSGKETEEPKESLSEEESQVAQEEAAAAEEKNPVEDLEAKLKEAEEKSLYVMAEFENTKKRLMKRSEEMMKYANEKIVEEIIPVLDNFDRAIDSLDQGHDPKSVIEGLHLVQNELHKVLKENGVEVIEAKGKEFDPNLHEAVGEVEDKETEEGCVAQELQRGYTLNGRLVRPSRVKISKNTN